MKNFQLIALIIIANLSFAQVGINFDGINDHVQAGSAGPQGTSDRTVECWFKTSNVISTQQVLVGWGAMSPLGRRFTLNYINNGRIRIEVGGNGFNTNRQITDGNWHHVAVTYDHSATVKACIYIDGSLDTCRNFTQSVNTSNTGPIQIGRRVDQANYFNGSIDEVRIWNIARNQSQINRFMNSEYCNVPTGLVAYYKMEEGIAGASNTGNTTVVDYAGSNNATLTNSSLNGSSSNWVNGVNLNTFQIPKAITQSMDTLYFTPAGVSSYQWVDCNTNTFLLNDTSNYLVPASSGSYAVLFTAGSCVDTSDCYSYVSTGIQDNNLTSFYELNSNVVSQNLSVNVNENALGTRFQLIDIQGKLIAEKQYSGNARINFEMPSMQGMYFLRVFIPNGQVNTHKVLRVN